MDNQFIVASSGFIIPANHYFKPFTEEDTVSDHIFNRSIVAANNAKVTEFYKDKNVYRSETINMIINDYLNDQSFDNFMKMLNVAIEIFKEIDFSAFFKLQATNTNLSSISYKFCLDIISGRYHNTYLDYSITPFNLRFTLNNGLTADKVAENIREFEKQSFYINNWETFLTELSRNKNAFVTFFKYVFADYY